jgi:MFS family permease
MMESNPVPPPPGQALREWRSGWPVVLAGLFGFALLSLGSTSMGAFMASVTADLHFSRSQFSAGLSAYALVGIVLGPLVGMLIDKVGVRVVAISGALLVGLAYSLFATATGAFAYWLALWLFYACANQLIMTTVWWAAVSRVFAASRGLAISLTIIGTGVAAPVAPIVANLLIEHQGWRAAFVIMGLSSGLAVALVCWLSLKPGGRSATAAQSRPTDAAPAEPVADGMTLAEAVRSLTFVKLAVASFLAYAVRLAITIHLIPMLSAGGVTRTTAVVIGGSYGLWMILGQIVSGAAMDRFAARWVSALCLAMMAVSLALLMLPPRPVALPIVAVALFGIAMGGMAPTFPYLTSRYFGLRSFGRLFGIIASLSGLGFATGPLLAGYVYDVSASYVPFLAAAIPALLVSALLIISMGRYPDDAEPASSSAARA